MNLYEIANNYLSAFQQIEQAETEEEQMGAMSELLKSEDDLTNKIENFVRFLKNTEAEAEKFKAEEKRIAEKRKSLENKAKNGKEFLKDTLEYFGLDTVQTDLFKVSIQNSQYSLIVDDESMIPKEYFKQNPVLDKKRLKDEMLETGELIEGVHLERGTHLRIR